MSITESYEQIFTDLEAIPEIILNKLNVVFKERFNNGTEALLKEMKDDLPLTFNEIQRNFVPKLCVRTILGIKKIYLIFEGNQYSLVSDLYNENFYDLYTIDKEYSFLPKKVQSYYYLTEGFQLVKDDLPKITWLDLPMSIVNRRSLGDFEAISEIKTPCRIKNMKGYKVWCLTSKDDVIVVDEIVSRFYYSNLSDLYNLKALKDIVTFWDSYCSFVIKNKSSDNFEFSKFFNK